ncbi:hypothetical protein IPN35_05355 [Candidatus Peregrinibacteria bacterium]|nr:MAG: hypothetical protein IPN35_05355 [Candidatus Peregrinibacteria bacterium]
MMNPFLSSAFGWLGMVGILLAYFLSSFHILSTDTVLYSGMNLIAAVCMGIHVWDRRAYPAVLLNTAWALIAITTLLEKILSS